MTGGAVRTTQPSSASRHITDYTKAILNILEDFSVEKARLEETQRAVLNIIEDSADEKMNLEGTQRAVINILDDFTGERDRLEETQRAALNILEDFSEEKTRLEETQKAMLNLLEDFDIERAKTETANLELRESVLSLQLAKEATEAANREIESFAYSVSHDLRTPLRSVAGFSQLLLADYSNKLDDEGKDHLRRIVIAAEKMGWLIDDLLKLSQVSMAVIERVPVDLSLLTGKIVDRLKKTHPERQAEVIISEGVFASGDEHLLTVVLENLLGNAWKFTERQEKAVIEFGVKEEIGHISPIRPVYFVKDNGIGFDMTFVDKLFNPFQRLHKIDEFPGTGIGLATVKRIINRHGGDVWIEGEMGKGTTVYFTL